MKISKLFHWLYAILMLLPVFFIGGRVLYTIFNKNAKDSYSGNQYIYEYKTNEVNSIADLVEGNIYKFQNYSSSANFVLKMEAIYFLNRNNNTLLFSITSTTDHLQVSGDIISSDNSTTSNINGSSFYFVYKSYTGDLQTYVDRIYQSDYLGSLTEDSLNTNKLDNAFSYSVNQLNENALFSWAKDSFIVEPFRYITGLFGMPSDSPVLTLLSYWCSISLIWLTFDLLMYVPLLVHRWLDKGVLE